MKSEDRYVRSDAARRQLSDLLDQVRLNGEHIFVLRYDKPVAVLVPVNWYEDARKEIQ